MEEGEEEGGGGWVKGRVGGGDWVKGGTEGGRGKGHRWLGEGGGSKDPGTKKVQNEKRNRRDTIRNLYGHK